MSFANARPAAVAASDAVSPWSAAQSSVHAAMAVHFGAPSLERG